MLGGLWRIDAGYTPEKKNEMLGSKYSRGRFTDTFLSLLAPSPAVAAARRAVLNDTINSSTRLRPHAPPLPAPTYLGPSPTTCACLFGRELTSAPRPVGSDRSRRSLPRSPARKSDDSNVGALDGVGLFESRAS